MKQDIKKELIKYVDKWVAVTSDYSELVASGNSISEVEKKLETTKYNLDSLVITYITSPDKFLSPTCLR
jgi:hypothetical protein